MFAELQQLVRAEGAVSPSAAAAGSEMDEAKNMALLFFMDHLMQKNGRRTIHDLSCQFGARGFTQEMRDAVGTTQEGLTEFLASYPSLFSVDADHVILRGFGEMDGKNHLMKMPGTGRQRDYEHEAVAFFEGKLQKFGPELQIKSLLGHRSQAAPEVRLVSGRHLKEFCEFLQSQTNHFIVDGDRVRLKNMPEPSEEVVELDDEGKPLVGVKAKQAAVDFLKGVLENNEDVPIPLENFYRRFCERFPHSVRQEVATNPKELLQFLKLNRNIFFIRSNKVSLVKLKPEDGESESGRSTTSADSSSDNNNVLFPLSRENLHRVHLVSSLRTAVDTVNNLRNDLNGQLDRFLGLDFKVVQLGSASSEEFLSMIIIASTSRIAIFDLAHSDVVLMESGLKELLEAADVLKVMHDVKRVTSLLAHRYNLTLKRVFGTQIAHTIIQHDKLSKPLAELRAISFLNLQRVYYPQALMNSDVTPRKLSQAPTWGTRPLTDDLMLAAAEECHCIVTALYRLLNSQLPDSCRRLFEDKCAEATIPPPSRPPSTGNLAAPTITSNGSSSNFDYPPNLYRPPARRQSSTTSNTSQQGGGSTSPHGTARLIKQHSSPGHWPNAKPKMVDTSTQTFSTGEITVLNVYYDT
ncbi:Egalitarian [Aphelenchoides fujianensis]|nr:Egalitarian [Aphelenchoides fujianensis]